MKYKKGFTLIELLVVISIIGVLSSVVLASLNGARVKARDATRKANIQQIKIALESYNTDFGAYPLVGCDGCGVNMSTLSGALAPYIKNIGADPIGATYQYVSGPSSPNGMNSYGLVLWSETTSSYCKTGVSMNAGWWGSPDCSF